MAAAAITYTLPNAMLGEIWLDAVLREEPTISADAPEHSVEGDDVVDHLRRRPDRVVFDCEITNTPVRAPQSHADGAQPADETVQTPDRTLFALRTPVGSAGLVAPQDGRVRGWSHEFDRVAAVWAEIDALVGSQVVTLSTSLQDYEDMVIEELTPSRTYERGHSLSFTMALKKIRRVSSALADAPVPTVERAKTVKSKGKVGKEEPSAQEAGAAVQQQSTLDALLSAAASAVAG